MSGSRRWAAALAVVLSTGACAPAGAGLGGAEPPPGGAGRPRVTVRQLAGPEGLALRQAREINERGQIVATAGDNRGQVAGELDAGTPEPVAAIWQVGGGQITGFTQGTELRAVLWTIR